jgi:hypothetical protein
MTGIPYYVFFEEIDSIAQKRGMATDTASSTQLNLMSSLLASLGSPDNINLFLIGTTNRKSAIDDAIVRPGRVGTTIYIGRLGAADRWQLFTRQWRALRLPEEGILTGRSHAELRAVHATVLSATQNFTGALVRVMVSGVSTALAGERIDATARGREWQMPTADRLLKLIQQHAQLEVNKGNDPDLFDRANHSEDVIVGWNTVDAQPQLVSSTGRMGSK